MHRHPVLLLSLCLILVQSGVSFGLPVNGNFSNGLTGWQTQGAVDIDSGAARLSDANGTADLTQAFFLAPGDYRLSFRINTAGMTDSDLFDDLFSATFYGLDLPLGDPLPADPLALVDTTIKLLDRTATAIQTHASGQFSLLNGWQLFEFHFNLIHNAGYLEFLLTGLDTLDGNSSFLLDDVVLTGTSPVVPEPVHLTALGLGLMATRLRRRMQRNRRSPATKGSRS